MRSAVTVSLVPEARGGPFVFWDDLDAACALAAALGFDAIEIFPPGPEVFEGDAVASTLSRHNLKLAAVGTGAGWVKHKLTLTSADADERKSASAFVRSIIDAAAKFGAPAIIGSMQGRWGGDVPQGRAIEYVRSALDALSLHAATRETILLYEPLNRYETNVCNTLAAGVELLGHMPASRVQLLADLFHMSIEESNLASAIRENGSRIGHVHLADSNRRPALLGHTNFEPIAEALREIGYAGYVSAECIDSDPASAAQFTIAAFNRYFRSR